MLTPTWLNLATQTLNRLESTSTCKVAVLGIGNELNGDDAVGVEITNAITQKLSVIEYDAVLPMRLIISAGPAPENFSGQLRRFQPDLVIFIDAAQLASQPGLVEWLPWQQSIGMSASTHSLPISVLSKYLVSEIGCEVYLIAIQAWENDFGVELSLPVRAAMQEVIQGLICLLFPRV